jgi:hypothetical protein
MEVVRELMRRPDTTETIAMGIFGVAAVYALFRGTIHTVLLGVAFAMIVLGALPKQKALAFLVGASAILLVQTRRRSPWYEGFEDASGSATAAEDASGDKAEMEETDASGGESAAAEEKPAAPARKEGFSAPITGGVLVPDNTDRQEPLVLGRPYKLPSEKDDQGYHLDAGTTFLNAYKALKPDQISAMTRDTQELLATQKSLVAMLDSFGPLLKDMGKITGFFGGSQ